LPTRHPNWDFWASHEFLPIPLGAAMEGRLYHRVRRDSAIRWLLSLRNTSRRLGEQEARYSFHSPRTRVTRLCCIISKNPLLCDVANSHNVNVRFQRVSSDLAVYVSRSEARHLLWQVTQVGDDCASVFQLSRGTSRSEPVMDSNS
jgi:hypothetical protein